MMREYSRYNVILDHIGYMVEPRSYRVIPAPLMGTRFATGRAAYASLDFWQVGGMTDFTKGINQKFMVDSSQYYYSEGIDVSKPGEFKLEQDLKDCNWPVFDSAPSAKFRSKSYYYIGTEAGAIWASENGSTWTKEITLNSKITCFFELRNKEGKNVLFACQGPSPLYRKVEGGDWEKVTPEVVNLYFVVVESDYAWGVFDDGIRQSLDGIKWTPEPPDPLWTLPAVEGIAINATAINRGILLGTERGLWLCIGGGSGLNIWSIPDYSNPLNFKGFQRWGPFAVFSVENQGIFYTDGSSIFPTNLNWQSEPFKCVSCRGIVSSGWDLFALVSEGANWYLARSNLVHTRAPKYWWIVKRLSSPGTKTPVSLVAFDYSRIFVFYDDGTAQSYNKNGTDYYQRTGFIESSLLDEGLVLLQKLYKSINVMCVKRPVGSAISISHRLNEEAPYDTERFLTTPQMTDLTVSKELPNPTLGNRLQWRIRLESPHRNESVIVSDVTWKYFLERPSDDETCKRTWNFVVLAEDRLEKLDFDAEELGREEARSRVEILETLWKSRSKKEILNFVGAENELSPAFEIQYTGSAMSCLMTIDKTNHRITFSEDGAIRDFYYKKKPLSTLVAEINSINGYSAVVDVNADPDQICDSLMPEVNTDIKGKTLVCFGTDVHAVIWNTQAPAQFKMELEGRGSDRVQVSLREA